MLKIVSTVLTTLFLVACAPATLNEGPSGTHLRAESARKIEGTIPPPIQQRIPLPKPKSIVKAETYSVVVNNVKVQDLLFVLARDAKLNVDIHSGIVGNVTLNAIDQTLPQLLSRITRQVDMRFELEDQNLVVMPDSPYLKNYKLDYVNLAREVTGTVSTNTQISTSALNGELGTNSPGGSNTSRIQIENKSKNHFWDSLEKNLKDLLHETDKIFPEGSTETITEQSATQSTSGTGAASSTTKAARGSQANQSLANSPNPAASQNSGLTTVKRMTFREAASVIANPESGVIIIRATSRQHEKVQEFLDRVMSSARRQVLIEATVVEVELSEGYQQGIEWSRLRTDDSGFSITQPGQSNNATNSGSPFVFTYLDKTNPLNLLATVNLLQSFGTLKVLSSPKLTVLNNQPATLKVSEDFVYFNVKSDVVAGTLNTSPTKAITTTPQSVSIGFFMSLTAQIGENNEVTLNIRPSISSISALKQDPNPDIPSSIPNYVPQIKTREIESLMRIGSGDIAVLGGLMEDRMDNRNGRVPGLGAIPLFGELFNSRANASKKTELVILIRPTIIQDASINGDFSQFSERLPDKNFFRTDAVYQAFGTQNPDPQATR